jgi:hypothetical protein
MTRFSAPEQGPVSSGVFVSTLTNALGDDI